METNVLIVMLLVVAVAAFLVYAWYTASRHKSKLATTIPSEPKPRNVTTEAKSVEPVSKPEPEFASVVEKPTKSVEPIPKPQPEAAPVEEKPTRPVEEKTSVSVESPKSVPSKVNAAEKPHASERKERGFNIVDIEGIGERYVEKLHKINIHTTADLLNAGATAHGRRELAEKTDIDSKLILEWVNLSDLFRIKGIGEEYSDLLEEAGVDTVVELSKRNAEHLHAKILEVNQVKKLVRRTPPLSRVEAWIEEAKSLPRIIEY